MQYSYTQEDSPSGRRRRAGSLRALRSLPRASCALVLANRSALTRFESSVSKIQKDSYPFEYVLIPKRIRTSDL